MISLRAANSIREQTTPDITSKHSFRVMTSLDSLAVKLSVVILCDGRHFAAISLFNFQFSISSSLGVRQGSRYLSELK